VSRILSTGTTVVDCAQRGACEIAALSEDENTVEAATPITFANVPLPRLAVAPSTALSDGQNVTVTGSNFVAGQHISFTECPTGQVEYYECDSDTLASAVIGSSGGFTTTYSVARILTTNQEYTEPGQVDPTVDCAQAPGCTLAAFGNEDQILGLPTPLTFDPSAPPLPPLNLTLSLTTSGTIGAGGTVTLAGTISCTSATPVDVTTEVNLAETANTLPATSQTTATETCVTAAAPVTFTVPDGDIPFVAGVAEVTLEIDARHGSSVTQQSMSGAVLLSVAAGTPPPVYYVALGDSLASGYASPSGEGYANDLTTYLQKSDPNIELVDLGCSGETTTSMIEGGICSYNGKSQLAAATSFLAANRGSVALVTVDIGGNDYINCINAYPEGYSAQCITNTNATVTTNLTTIVSQIQAAAGPTVPMLGMNYFDPFLDEWPGGAPGQALARESVPVVGEVNDTIGAVYQGAAMAVADVAGAFQTTDLSHKVKSYVGRVPVAVANTCNWLDFTCEKGQGGYGDDANAAGSAVVAGAFEKVVPADLSSAAKKRK
jgi:lysophospholipase L1-like esterase